MDNSIIGSLSLLGLWMTIGIVYYIIQRDRQRSKNRKIDVEQELALWVEDQRRQGVSATSIAERLDQKRNELLARKSGP